MHCTGYTEEKEKLGEVVDYLETGANLDLLPKRICLNLKKVNISIMN